MSYRIRFDQSKCVGCYACYTACIDAHHDPGEENAESFRTIRRIVREEEQFQKNICVGCLHCGACMRICPAGAIYKDEDTGFILIDPDHCVGCGTCMPVCPNGVIRLHDRTASKCDGCIGRIAQGREPACVRACPTGAILFSEV